MSSQPDFVPVPDIADLLGLSVTKVHQLLRERKLLGVRSGGILRIPAEFVADGAVVNGLPGTITLLDDAGFDDEEILHWLFADDPSLPGNPIGQLRAGGSKEIHRRAQTAGF